MCVKSEYMHAKIWPTLVQYEWNKKIGEYGQTITELT
jgi:hypothetical protein